MQSFTLIGKFNYDRREDLRKYASGLYGTNLILHRAEYELISENYIISWNQFLLEKSKQKRYIKQLEESEKSISRERRLFIRVLRKVLRQKITDPIDKKKRKNEYAKNLYHTSLNQKMVVLLRSRLRIAMKENRGVFSAVRLLGCTIPEFQSYIESKFQDGMTWDNWGIFGWHLDHIIPLASFDLSDENEVRRACHYTNMCPLWAADNLKKIKQDREVINRCRLEKSIL